MVADGYKDTEIGVIPVEWEVVRLSDIMNLIHGYQFRTEDFTEDGICVIKIKNVSGNKLELNDISYISANRYEEFKQYKINTNDILMSLTGNIGRVIEVDNLPFTVLQNYRVGKFEPISENILYKKYIKFIFSSNIIFNKLQKLSNQSAQANFGKQDMDKLIFPLPPLKEQEKIADILSTADDKIDAIASQIQKAQTLKKGLLQKLLSEGIGHSEFKDSELGTIPKSWEVVKLGKICNLTAGGTPSTSEKSYWQPQEISWLLSGEVNKKKLFYTDKKISKKGLDNSSAKLLPYNSILIALAGQGKTRGTVAITEIELTTNQSVAAILPTDKIIPYYLYFNLASRYYELRSLSTGSGGRGGLNLTILKSVHIQFPPFEEQKQIAEILSTADEKLEVLMSKKEKYETLKKGLLQKLLSGEVRV